MPRFFVLGSAGWIPTPQRQTSCYLLETRRSLVFFDLGTGVSRLHDPMFKELIARHRRAVILLSHWHHDHIEGLPMMPFFLSNLEVALAVPGPSITGFRAAEVLGRYGGKPLLPTPLLDLDSKFPAGFSVVELHAGTNKVLGETIQVLPQPHSDPSIAFRVRDVTYVTDTKDRPETVEFARKSALLIHDAWLDRAGVEAEPADAAVHGTAEGAARIAHEAGVKDLVLGHLNPAYDAARLDRMLFEAATIFPKAVLAADMLALKLEEVAEEAPDPASTAAQVS
jgi:ribonuclease BN (tRNA processing enzyme)